MNSRTPGIPLPKGSLNLPPPVTKIPGPPNAEQNLTTRLAGTYKCCSTLLSTHPKPIKVI